MLPKENSVETAVRLSKGDINGHVSSEEKVWFGSRKKLQQAQVRRCKTASVYAGEGRGDHAGAQALLSDLEKDCANEYQSIFGRLLWNYRV